MISKHCGQRLVRLTSDERRHFAHSWRCGVCGRIFRQKVRTSKIAAFTAFERMGEQLTGANIRWSR